VIPFFLRSFLACSLAGATLAACSGGSSQSSPEDIPDAAATDASPAPPGADASLDDASPHGPDAASEASYDAASPGDAAPDAPPFVTAPHEPWPTLKSHGGPVLSNPTVVAIVPQNHGNASDLIDFANAMPGSHWWSALSAEYGLGTMSMVPYQGSAITGSIDESGLIQYVQGAIGQNVIPGPDGHTVYLLFVPSEAQVSGAPCASYPGYHDTFPMPGGTGAGDSLALVITCGYDWLDPIPLDYLTTTAAHEVAESITDPLLSAKPAWRGTRPWPPQSGTPWFQPVSELGDLCNNGSDLEGGFLFQRIWSVKNAAKGGDPCIPQSPYGYYGVTQKPGASDWTQVEPGKSVKIPLVGWRTGPSAPEWWLVQSYLNTSSTAMQSLTMNVTSPKQGHFGSCGTLPIADNGGAAGSLTLTVTAPSGAASGDWAVIDVNSYRQDDTSSCTATRGTDLRTDWFLGVYVP
jgi:hypothetical protein